MTQAEMLARLRKLEVKKAFRPYAEDGRGEMLLETKRPAQLVDGRLMGCEIALMRDDVFRVWTAHTRLAREVAKRNFLRVRFLDGEAELWVPPALADKLLPKLGAKLKRQSSPRQLEALKRARQASPITQMVHRKPCANGGFGLPDFQVGGR